MSEGPLGTILRTALGDFAASLALAGHPLETVLEEVFAAGRSAWPDVALDEGDLLGHLADKLREAQDPAAALRTLHVVDLYLACACAGGDPAAVAAFEQHVLPATKPALARLNLPGGALEECTQQLREHLLVGREGGLPAIASYSARGPLRAWVKVTAVRAALKVNRSGPQRREVPVEERVLEALPPGSDPELDFLKEHYRGAFKRSVRAAIAELGDRELNLIRQHYLDGLTTYELGALYRVHQATASRWLDRARQAILRSTRRTLMQQLRVGRAEYESIMRLIESRLDVTLQSFLLD